MTKRTGRFLRSIRAGSVGEDVVMEWVPWPWEQGLDEPVGSQRVEQCQESLRSAPSSGAECHDLDTWMMALIYRSIAGTSWCEICGARFARGLRVLATPAGARRPRQILVVAKCRGWKRHVHVANVVVNEDSDISLQPLRATA